MTVIILIKELYAKTENERLKSKRIINEFNKIKRYSTITRY